MALVFIPTNPTLGQLDFSYNPSTLLCWTKSDVVNNIDDTKGYYNISGGVWSSTPMWINGVSQGSFFLASTWAPASTTKTEIIYLPAKLAIYTTYTVDWEIWNGAGGSSSGSYSFSTLGAGPLMTPIGPTLYELITDLSTDITFDVTESVVGVDISQGSLTLDHSQALSAPTVWTGASGFQSGFQGPNSSVTPITNGYRFVVDSENDFSNRKDSGNIYVNTYGIFYDNNGISAARLTTFLLPTNVKSPVTRPTYPTDGQTDIPVDANITFEITDNGQLLFQEDDFESSTIEVQIAEGGWTEIWRFSTGFAAKWNGSSITTGLTWYSWGHDNETVVLSYVGNLPENSLIKIRVTAYNYNNIRGIDTWSFTTFSSNLNPFVESEFPARNANGIPALSLISFSVIDPESNINVSTIDAYVEGILAFSNSVFIAPYNGADSTFFSISTAAGGGYSITIDKDEDLTFGLTDIRVLATDADGGSVDDSWSFTVPDVSGSIEGNWTGNNIYFSDGCGLKKIEVADMVGDFKNAITTLSSYPTILSNDINSIFTEVVNGNLCISLCYTDGCGTSILINETDLKNYGDGYNYNDTKISDKGILYAVNETYNQIEVYYGADYRGDTARSPDFIYNESSTPSLLGGKILCLCVENEGSVKLKGGARLFVGTTLGFTRIDTYDSESVDGYSADLESYGLSSTFGIVGSGAQYEKIGGFVARVTNISTDGNSTIFVGTRDSVGNGGVTQISLSGNQKIIFLTKENGMLLSNDVTDIFGKIF